MENAKHVEVSKTVNQFLQIVVVFNRYGRGYKQKRVHKSTRFFTYLNTYLILLKSHASCPCLHVQDYGNDT